MRDLHPLWALKEGRHKWNPSVKRDRRGTTFEGNIFVASRAAGEDQDDSTVLQNVDRSLDRGRARLLRAVSGAATDPVCHLAPRHEDVAALAAVQHDAPYAYRRM
jgi:hypothetical protein